MAKYNNILIFFTDIPVEILYIILSVAGVVLVATVILTVFVCLACYQNRRVSKNAQLMRLSMQVSEGIETAPLLLAVLGRGIIYCI